MKVKPLPFRISRGIRVNLVEQTVEGIRRAIATGYYRAGDYLPSYEAMAAELGVSVRIPTDAIRRLVADNYVSPRPRIGCLVLPRTDVCWRGRVIFTIPGECQSGYFAATLIAEARRLLSLEGYLSDTIGIAMRNGRNDQSQLDEKLRDNVNFVITVFSSKTTLRRIEHAGVPHAGVMLDECRGVFHPVFEETVGVEDAMSELIGECRRKGVRTVLVLSNGRWPDMVDALRAARLRTEEIRIPSKAGFGFIERLRQDVMERLLSRFGAKDARLPDLIVSTDDVVTEGAIAAFDGLGVAFPRDAGFVTFANAGNVPIYARRFTCLLNDPRTMAADLVGRALGHLEGRRDAASEECRLAYAKGETF